MSSLEQRMLKVREQFPALKQKFGGKDFVYLDSTNTTLKPQRVIDRVTKFYTEEASNVHRGGYQWSARTTALYESARTRAAQFIGAEHPEEIIYVRGTTEAINLVAESFGHTFIKPGDEILISEMEHHGNIVPWHMLQERYKAVVKAVRIHDNGDLDLEDLKNKLSAKTKIVALTACSNTLGTITPLEKIVQIRTLDTYTPQYPAVKNLAERDILLVKTLLDRHKQYPNKAHFDLIDTTAQTLENQLHIKNNTPQNPILFLKTLIDDYIVLTR